MSRITLQVDLLEQESIRRRQKLEEDRKKRFFDPRTRCLGVRRSGRGGCLTVMMMMIVLPPSLPPSIYRALTD